MNITDHFQKTAIINLPERKDRRTETIAECKRINCTIDNHKTAFFPAVKPAEPAGFPSIGVRGCFLSHMEVIRQAQQYQLGNILVMEDDIAFTPSANAILAEAMLELAGKEWGFLYLGHEYPVDSSRKERLLAIHEPLLLAHCYAVNSTIFQSFLAFLEQLLQRPPGHPDGGPMHYDGAISTFRMQNPGITTYILNPSIAYQRSSRTDLHEISLWDRMPFLSPFIKSMRTLKNTMKRLSLQ
ncbi:MAG: glycosyltransferase family 25 protein [Chlorobium sp.]|uniref:glycosyltransferase family 25 protein n=1 Tax=Chlorobium sp. TaxID=1095 RepID=UPI0025C0E2AC|nr:glycosyltransferase family 25 protein [Chlorobium sp.]MCF8383080.1 glycosyltransferase family 25 protein [Chlorobium sp.]